MRRLTYIENQPPGKTKLGESEEEKLANSPTCMHCKKERIQLYLLPYKRMKLRACTNNLCFKYTDLTKIFSWTWKP